MGVFDGNNMRGMTQEHFNDSKLNKSRELNDGMSIDYQKSEDTYGNQVHSLSKQSLTDEGTEEV